MKIVFFGSSRYVVPVLENLNFSHQVVLVVTTEQGLQEPVKFFCQNHKIPCISIKKSGELIANTDIHTTQAEIGVVADFGVIIPQDIINFFPKGIINIHPSLLPLYRGPTPVQSAILNGDTQTGVSIISLDKYMDHGPILIQEVQNIEKEDTAKSLYEMLFKKGAQLIIKIIEGFEHSTITSKEQNHEKATFTKILARDDGYFDYKSNNDLNFIDKLTRAYYPWPGAWTKVKLNPSLDEKIVKFLPRQMIQVEGKNEMFFKDFINGYPECDKQFLEILRKAISK